MEIPEKTVFAPGDAQFMDDSSPELLTFPVEPLIFAKRIELGQVVEPGDQFSQVTNSRIIPQAENRIEAILARHGQTVENSQTEEGEPALYTHLEGASGEGGIRSASPQVRRMRPVLSTHAGSACTLRSTP